MDSTSSISSASPGPETRLPVPPPHLYRTITRLYGTLEVAIYLVLPREIPTPRAASDSDEEPAAPPFPSFTRTNLSRAHVALVPHFRLVTMSTNVSTLRSIVKQLELTFSDRIKRVQFTSEPESSWFVSIPVYSVSLPNFGLRNDGIPGWFLAHILLGILAAGCAGDVMFDMYPRYDTYRFRNWPEIVVVPHGGRDDEDDVLWAMEQAIATWSDVPFMDTQGDAGMTEPLLGMLDEVQALRHTHGGIDLDDLQDIFWNRLEDLRLDGPKNMPRRMLEFMHADLATDAEIENALREPMVLKFETKKDEFKRLISNERVEMGSGGYAGMRTVGIMVIRFQARKDDFLRAVKEDLGPWEGEDADGEYELDDDMPDAWTPEDRIRFGVDALGDG
jgi:hypothetical protein